MTLSSKFSPASHYSTWFVYSACEFVLFTSVKCLNYKLNALYDANKIKCTESVEILPPKLKPNAILPPKLKPNIHSANRKRMVAKAQCQCTYLLEPDSPPITALKSRANDELDARRRVSRRERRSRRLLRRHDDEAVAEKHKRKVQIKEEEEHSLLSPCSPNEAATTTIRINVSK